jgi:hypothetical protein
MAQEQVERQFTNFKCWPAQCKNPSIRDCSDFESDSEKGRASIKVNYTFYQLNWPFRGSWEKMERSRSVTFRKTDQGWKVD